VGQVEDVAGKQVALLLQQVVGLLLASDAGRAELEEEQDQLERGSPHLTTRWNRAAD